MARSIDLDNPRYRSMWGRPFGELCTRLRMQSGEVISGVSCCDGLISDMTDDYEKKCKTCKHFLVWQQKAVE